MPGRSKYSTVEIKWMHVRIEMTSDYFHLTIWGHLEDDIGIGICDEDISEAVRRNTLRISCDTEKHRRHNIIGVDFPDGVVP